MSAGAPDATTHANRRRSRWPLGVVAVLVPAIAVAIVASRRSPTPPAPGTAGAPELTNPSAAAPSATVSSATAEAPDGLGLEAGSKANPTSPSLVNSPGVGPQKPTSSIAGRTARPIVSAASAAPPPAVSSAPRSPLDIDLK